MNSPTNPDSAPETDALFSSIEQMPENQQELLSNLSDSDGMFYYENNSNSALFISVGIHIAVFALLVTWKTTIFKGAADEQSTEGGIVVITLLKVPRIIKT